MVRVLLVDQNGEGLDLSWRAQSYGHAVRHFIKDEEKYNNIGLGVVEVVREWKKHTDWADVIIFADNTLYLQDADRLRADGKNVVGASVASARLELDREYGMSVFRKHGIQVIPYKTFEDYDKAISYVKSTGGRYVSKPDDDKGDKALSYVAKNAADLIYMLERWKKNDKLHGKFILQTFVPGTEMAVGGWLGPQGFIGGWCENFEHKKLMPGDMGPNTGEMGTVLHYTKKSKLANMVLKPLEQFLINTGHVGYVDVNCIIDERGNPWPLEFTMRFGWPTINIQSSLHADVIPSLVSLANGGSHFATDYHRVAIGACVAIPDFPYSHVTRKDVIGIPIYGLTASIIEHIHPCQMMMKDKLPYEKDGKVEYKAGWATAGDYVMIVTANGNTVEAARESLNRRLKRISIPNSPFHRNDIGRKLAQTLPHLHEMGFAKNLQYN